MSLPLDRRAFLTTGSLGAAALALGGATPTDAQPAVPRPPAAVPPFEFDEVTVAGLQQAMAGGRHTVEDAVAYAAFAREVLDTRDVDFRIRPHSDEEAAFLRSHVQGRPLEVTYADLDRASAVLLVAFEPE